MKNQIIVCLLCLFSIPGVAQFYIGPEAGIALGLRNKTDFYDRDDNKLQPSPALFAGIQLKHMFDEKIGIKSKLGVIQTGQTSKVGSVYFYEDDFGTPEIITEAKFVLRNTELFWNPNFEFQYGPEKAKGYINAGFMYAVLIKRTQVTKTGVPVFEDFTSSKQKTVLEQEEISEFYNRHDVKLNGAIGVLKPLKNGQLDFNVAAYIGMLDQVKNRVIGKKLLDRTFVVSIAYLFEIGAKKSKKTTN